MSLPGVESQNAKWKTENNGRRETSTRLPRIKTTVNSERLYLTLVLFGFVYRLYCFFFIIFLCVRVDDYIVVPN